jgi:hypothetical protein
MGPHPQFHCDKVQLVLAALIGKLKGTSIAIFIFEHSTHTYSALCVDLVSKGTTAS